MSDTGVRRTVHVVPHTHWDREWYEPFQRFRLQLVDLLDEVLPRLQADPRFRFTLDGQTAAVDDYLEVRPDALPVVVELVRAGQLAVGPWRVLADSFLCSGENLVRNLEIGLARAAELGGAMRIGYIPDQFGHTAQLPQLLRGFGFTQACLWRGVPGTVDRHAFGWVAPDGSAVRTEYLPGGYGNAAVLFSDPTATARRAEEFAERMRDWFGDVEPLAMYGTDHGAPLPTLVDQVAAVRESGTGVTLRLETLAEALAGRADLDLTGLPEVRGELRSHAMANLLPGILSVRAPVKQAMAAAERMVQRYAEPLAALWAPAAGVPFLGMAWLRLVDASCHDSVTGCGADSTAEQVAARISEAEQLGSAVRDRVLRDLAGQAPGDGLLVVNPSIAARADLVRAEVVAPEEWTSLALELADGSTVATQEVGRASRVLYDAEFPAAQLVDAILRRTFGQVMFSRSVQRVTVADREVVVAVGRIGDPGYDVETLAVDLRERTADQDGPWRLRVVDEPRREVVAVLPAPALGWASVRPVAGTGALPANPVSVVEGSVRNGLVTATVRLDGTLRVVGADGTVLEGVGRIVDGGDAGDSYNYAPPTVDSVVEVASSVTVEPGPAGPLVGGFTVRRGYPWPRGLADFDGTARSESIVDTEVVMAVELRAGEPFIRLELSFDNRSTDHRVRLHVPTAVPAEVSVAEGQFSVVTRGLVNEGGNGEEPLPTFPAYSFVDAGGAAVLLEHVTEYEVVEQGDQLALTLLRAVGAISRNANPLRAEPAGPTTPIPAAQLPGVRSVRFGVLPHGADWSSDDVLSAAERFAHPLVAVAGTGAAGASLSTVEGLEVTGRGVTLGALRHRDGVVELRLAAYSHTPVTATVRRTGLLRAQLTDLAGTVLNELNVTDNTATVDLRPWEIATLRLS